MKYLVKWTQEVDYSVVVEAASSEEAATKAFEEESYIGALPDDRQGIDLVPDSIEVKEKEEDSLAEVMGYEGQAEEPEENLLVCQYTGEYYTEPQPIETVSAAIEAIGVLAHDLDRLDEHKGEEYSIAQHNYEAAETFLRDLERDALAQREQEDEEDSLAEVMGYEGQDEEPKQETVYKCPECGSVDVKWIGSIYDPCNPKQSAHRVASPEEDVDSEMIGGYEVMWTGTCWCPECSDECKPEETEEDSTPPLKHSTPEDRLTMIHDPGHGWLVVPIADVEASGIEVSEFSYKDSSETGNYYLEEDCDAPRYLIACGYEFGAPLQDFYGALEHRAYESIDFENGAVRCIKETSA